MDFYEYFLLIRRYVQKFFSLTLCIPLCPVHTYCITKITTIIFPCQPQLFCIVVNFLELIATYLIELNPLLSIFGPVYHKHHKHIQVTNTDRTCADSVSNNIIAYHSSKNIRYHYTDSHIIQGCTF